MSSVHAERKKREFFVPFIWSEGNFFNMCFISMYIVSNTPSVHTFTYRKILLHTLLLLGFKIVESLQCIINQGFHSNHEKERRTCVFCGLSNLKFHKFLKVTNPSSRKEICKKNKNCPVYFEIGHVDIYVPNKIINRKTVMVNIILQAHGNRLGGRGWGAAAPQIFAKFYFFMN